MDESGDLYKFLFSLGKPFLQYYQKFSDDGYDTPKSWNLINKQILQEMGVKIGHQQVICDAISSRNSSHQLNAPRPDSKDESFQSNASEVPKMNEPHKEKEEKKVESKEEFFVRSLLSPIHLEIYIQSFLDAGYDNIYAVRELTVDDLKILNVKRGHHKPILNVLKLLEPESPSAIGLPSKSSTGSKDFEEENEKISIEVEKIVEAEKQNEIKEDTDENKDKPNEISDLLKIKNQNDVQEKKDPGEQSNEGKLNLKEYETPDHLRLSEIPQAQSLSVSDSSASLGVQKKIMLFIKENPNFVLFFLFSLSLCIMISTTFISPLIFYACNLNDPLSSCSFGVSLLKFTDYTNCVEHNPPYALAWDSYCGPYFPDTCAPYITRSMISMVFFTICGFLLLLSCCRFFYFLYYKSQPLFFLQITIWIARIGILFYMISVVVTGIMLISMNPPTSYDCSINHIGTHLIISIIIVCICSFVGIYYISFNIYMRVGGKKRMELIITYLIRLSKSTEDDSNYIPNEKEIFRFGLLISWFLILRVTLFILSITSYYPSKWSSRTVYDSNTAHSSDWNFGVFGLTTKSRICIEWSDINLNTNCYQYDIGFFNYKSSNCNELFSTLCNELFRIGIVATICFGITSVISVLSLLFFLWRIHAVSSSTQQTTLSSSLSVSSETVSVSSPTCYTRYFTRFSLILFDLIGILSYLIGVLVVGRGIVFQNFSLSETGTAKAAEMFTIVLTSIGPQFQASIVVLILFVLTGIVVIVPHIRTKCCNRGSRTV